MCTLLSLLGLLSVLQKPCHQPLMLDSSLLACLMQPLARYSTEYLPKQQSSARLFASATALRLVGEAKTVPVYIQAMVQSTVLLFARSSSCSLLLKAGPVSCPALMLIRSRTEQ